MNDYSDKNNNNIYPQLEGEKYRLYISLNILSSLQKEQSHYENVRKIYNKYSKMFQNISVSTGSLSIIFSMSGLGASLSGYGIIVGVPLGAIGGCCGLTSVGTGLFSKKLNRKVLKHERITMAAKSKINSIQSEISKGLIDGKIDDIEFKKNQKESEQYFKVKYEIRKSHRREKKEIGPSEINLLLKNTIESFQKLGQSVVK